MQQKRIGVNPCDRNGLSVNRGPSRVWPKLFVYQGRGPLLRACYNALVRADSPMLVRYQRGYFATRFFDKSANENLRRARVRCARTRNRYDVGSELQTLFDVIDSGYPGLQTGSFSDRPVVNDNFVVVSCCNFQPRLSGWHAKKYFLSEISYRRNNRRFDPLGIAEIELILALLWTEVGLLYIITEHKPARQHQAP